MHEMPSRDVADLRVFACGLATAARCPGLNSHAGLLDEAMLAGHSLQCHGTKVWKVSLGGVRRNVTCKVDASGPQWRESSSSRHCQ